MEQGIPPLPTQPVVHVGIELQDSIKVTIQNKKKTQTQYFDWEVPPRVSSVYMEYAGPGYGQIWPSCNG